MRKKITKEKLIAFEKKLAGMFRKKKIRVPMQHARCPC